MSFTVIVESGVVFSKTSSTVCFKQHYTDYLTLLTEQIISSVISLLQLQDFEGRKKLHPQEIQPS